MQALLLAILGGLYYVHTSTGQWVLGILFNLTISTAQVRNDLSFFSPLSLTPLPTSIDYYRRSRIHPCWRALLRTPPKQDSVHRICHVLHSWVVDAVRNALHVSSGSGSMGKLQSLSVPLSVVSLTDRRRRGSVRRGSMLVSHLLVLLYRSSSL